MTRFNREEPAPATSSRMGGDSVFLEALYRVHATKLAAGDEDGALLVEELIEVEEALRSNPPPPTPPPGMAPGASPIGWYVRLCVTTDDELICERCTPKPHGGAEALAANVYPLRSEWQFEPGEVPTCVRCGRTES